MYAHGAFATIISAASTITTSPTSFISVSSDKPRIYSFQSPRSWLRWPAFCALAPTYLSHAICVIVCQ